MYERVSDQTNDEIAVEDREIAHHAEDGLLL
jgi:hypothetical protein